MTFWMAFFGLISILSAMGVVAFKRPLNCALSLIVTLLSIAAHYALLSADFLATVQVMVYAGAIMVLVVFVIMLLGDNDEVPLAQGGSPKGEEINIWTWVTGIISGSTIFLIIGFGIAGSPFGRSVENVPDGSAAGLGDLLYNQYLFPFEIISLLILSAVIGAVVLGTENKRALKPGRGLKATRDKNELRKAA
jgi:NADH-quinone oxidoreductase subunit J